MGRVVIGEAEVQKFTSLVSHKTRMSQISIIRPTKPFNKRQHQNQKTAAFLELGHEIADLQSHFDDLKRKAAFEEKNY